MGALAEHEAKGTSATAAASVSRVALVGCGAVAERIHLPALLEAAGVRLTALVDADPARLAALAARAGPGVYTARSTAGVERYADMAVVAVPNHLHAPVAADLLERGLHVLVEKPLALSLAEAGRLVEVASRSGRNLGVALIRRHYASFEFVQQVLSAGWLGRIRSFDFREGVVNVWPATTLALFQRKCGGGVLPDAGAHALDWLLAWLGPFDRVSYRDDARGGVEANCLLELELRGGARGVVELSRTRGLRNTCIMRGDAGEIEVGVQPDGPLILRSRARQVAGVVSDGGAEGAGIAGSARVQLESFARSVAAAREPPVAARSALESLRLIDACRAGRQALGPPWEPFTADIEWRRLAGKRVLVLGGTGFLGGRVVEALAQNSTARIRVLAHSPAGVANVARYPVEIVRGDVGDPDVLRRVLPGCDYVINCTYGKGARAEQHRVNVAAVRSLIAIAAESRVRRIVHTSTMMVYGVVTDGVLAENVAARPMRGDDYGYTKWQGEQLALREGRRLGVPVVVVQPTAIYGPGAPSWTVNPITTMKSARIVLVNGGSGVSNAVYVDDVVTALLAAMLEPRAAGERFLIGGPDVVTWRDFFGAYDALLGGGRTVSLDTDEIAAARRVQAQQRGNLVQLRALIREERQARQRLLALPAVAAVRRALEATLPAALVARIRREVTAGGGSASPRMAPGDPIRLPSRFEESFFRAAARVDCSKAAILIGYRPRYAFASGMKMTGAWAAWAELV